MGILSKGWRAEGIMYTTFSLIYTRRPLYRRRKIFLYDSNVNIELSELLNKIKIK